MPTEPIHDPNFPTATCGLCGTRTWIPPDAKKPLGWWFRLIHNAAPVLYCTLTCRRADDPNHPTRSH